ncbi:MarR family winged helix-turn-helix transcriptional regulator [Rhizobium sp. NZLR1]|uniref:MarR family winged helix-turn-helix transcriptional regulator n=1 Tax=Rhizobium sp. NZLR1 TaxID=2731096 RepID=UPI001A986251|nr:MarR family winged helix-turn-helix transcriptional regulator [Rhizobium sp. NZLR1]QSZ25163.1 winged helix-turn-helix transcriptional regulator [Rhizobium sp. NZLR1]
MTSLKTPKHSAFDRELFQQAAERSDRKAYVALSVKAGEHMIPGLDASAMELSLTLMQTTGMINYDLESATLRSFGFTTGSFHLAFVIALVSTIEGSKLPGITGMSRANISGIVKTLEKNGIITKHPSARDGRVMLIKITDFGHDRVIAAWAEVNKREQVWSSRLTNTERKQLVALLGKLSSRSDSAVKKRG